MRFKPNLSLKYMDKSKIVLYNGELNFNGE